MNIRPEVIQRILLAKAILSPYRFAPWSEPDAYVIAMQLLAAHDAADLVFAAIVDHQGKGTNKSRGFSMMESLGTINTDGNSQKPTTYFGQLSEARDSLKHRSNFPNTKQWANAGRTVYEKLSEMSEACLGLSLDDVDESALLTDDQLKNYFAAAQKAAELGEHKTALEELGKALCILLDKNSSLGEIFVGMARAEDAIKLSGFGVHANDFLRLQEFLPHVWHLGDGIFQIVWAQSKFGHPGNWREEVVQFCLQAFLNVAPRIQDAKWIPFAIDLSLLYEYRVTAKEDDVEIWVKAYTLSSEVTRNIVGRLNKGESKTFSARDQPLVSEWHDEAKGESFKVVKLQENTLNGGPLYGELGGLFAQPEHFVRFDKVMVTCVPKDLEWIRERFPYLVEMPWMPDDGDDG